MINFNTTKREAQVIHQIVMRASKMAEELGCEYPPLDIDMDITAAHRNGSALHLTGLLGASDFDFAHDVFGIRRHIDRATGKVGDCFVPRYSVSI